MNNDWLERARSSHKRGDYAGALQACAGAPADTRSQVLAHSVRASALAKLGRAEHALGEIRAAFDLGARSIELYRLGAEVCVAQGEPEVALEWIDRALKAGACSERLLGLRGEIVSSMHLLSGVHEHQELVVDLCPEWLEAREKLIDALLRLRLYSFAEEHLEVAIAQSPRRASLHIDKAIVCMETGRAQIAVDVLEHALSLEVGIAERVRIASLFVKAGALDRAVRTAHESHTLAPDSAEARLQCGFFALWQGDPRAADGWCDDLSESTRGLARLRAAIALVDGRDQAALAMATQAVVEDSASAEAHALRAVALLRLARYDEAHRQALTAGQATPEWLPSTQLIEVAADAARQPTIPRHDIAELFDLLAPLVPRPVGLDKRKDVAAQPVRDAIETGLRRLSGNFTNVLTFVPDGSRTWASFSSKLPARIACVRVFDFILARPWAWVADRMGLLAGLYPGSPYVHTHAAELWLWCGEYAACEAECRRALALTKIQGSRWAWVGLGGALMLQERYAEALDVFAESNRLMEPGAPLLAYRGETLRRCAQLDAARQDLTKTLRLVPTRVSAWLNLGLIASAQGHYDEVRDVYARLHAQLPQLMRDFERDMGGTADSGARDVDAMAATFEHALRAMRGNRSSGRVTYFLKDGVARLLPARALTSASVSPTIVRRVSA